MVKEKDTGYVIDWDESCKRAMLTAKKVKIYHTGEDAVNDFKEKMEIINQNEKYT